MTYRPAPGSRIGPYEVITEIARGGMAQVLLARDQQMGRDVALKLLAPDLSEDAGFRQRFLRETKITATLEHPNVVPVYDAGEFEGLLYIVMRYISGPDLRAVLKKGPLDIARAISIVAHIGSALDAAHQAGLVHRDVKPGNILLVEPASPDDVEHAYLTDFGLVWRPVSTDDRTQPGALLGTPNYAAPEQLQGVPVDGRADIYALGAVLYACITGEPPFPRESTVAAIAAHLHEEPPRASALRPDVPAALDAVIISALAKAREDRPRTCAELVRAARVACGLTPGVSNLDTTAVPGAPRRLVKLPATAHPLVGRALECTEISHLLSSADHRVVTLVGPGGAGKTRLAVEVATTVVDAFPGGMFFVPLAEARDSESLVAIVAGQLEVQEEPGDSLLTTVTRSLVNQRTLLVLDNLEQATGAAATIADLVDQAPQVTVLATSRVPLHLSAEQRYPISPLTEGDAAELFQQRAQAVDPHFPDDEETLETVKAICDRVEGSPLAIELAAARVAVLSPSELHQRLSEQLSTLTSGSSDAPERQRTLRATIAWSVDLLSSRERETLEAMSTFGGYFTIADAEAVVGATDDVTFESLASLVDSNLVRRFSATRASEYRLLDSVREFAWQAAVERGRDEALRERLSGHLLRTVVEQAQLLSTHGASNALRELRRVYPTVRSTIPWMLDHRPSDAAALCVSLRRYWMSDGQLSEARAWIAHLMGRPQSADPAASGELLLTAGVLAYLQDDRTAARTHLELIVSTADPGAVGLLGLATGYLGTVDLGAGDTESAQRRADDAHGLAEASGEYEPRILALSLRAVMAAVAGDLPTEQGVYQQRLRLSREQGDSRGIAETLNNLAEISLIEQDLTSGRAYAEEALERARPLTRMVTRDALYTLGRIELHDGHLAEALARAQDALQLCLNLGQLFEISQCVTLVGAVASADGDHRAAARLMGAGANLRQEGAPLDVDLEPDIGAYRDQTRDALGATPFDLVSAAGAELSRDDAVAMALGFSLSNSEA